jgi:hypothetical protein
MRLADFSKSGEKKFFSLESVFFEGGHIGYKEEGGVRGYKYIWGKVI